MRARPPAAWVSVLYCQGTCYGVGNQSAFISIAFAVFNISYPVWNVINTII